MKNEQTIVLESETFPATKLATMQASEMLTPSELELLRQDLKDSNAYFKKLYAKAS